MKRWKNLNPILNANIFVPTAPRNLQLIELLLSD